MSRPTEYDNLIKTKALEAVASTPGAIAGFLRNAADYRVTAEGLDPERHMQVFTLAYEGYFQVVQAILEFYQVRTKEAGRNLAIQFITKAHERRNGTCYVSPFPPVSKAEAVTMLAILTKYLPVAHTLTGTS
jgi:hypothetical protein